MAWGVGRGHVTGTSTTMLQPLLNMDRGTAAALFQRFATTNQLLRFGGVVALNSAVIDIAWKPELYEYETAV